MRVVGPLLAVSAAVAAAGCATLGADGVGDRDLPTAGVGPFRKLEHDEVSGTAPYVLADRAALYREPAVVGLEGDAVALFVVARDGAKDVVVRVDGNDPRTFDASPRVVLRSDATWEGDALSGPALVRRDGEWLLYYAAAGGIGLARSTDGVAFVKERSPVLASDGAASWETTPPRAPSAAVFPDGSIHLFYASGGAIGEAVATDGASFRRAAVEPVLAASPAREVDTGDRPPFDTAAVGDPCVTVRTTAAGRLHVRVLYTGQTPDGASAIGFAARFGEVGPLTRQLAPVLAIDRHEAGAAMLERGGRTILYVQMDRTESNQTYPAIGAAIAPVTARLPAP